MNKLISTVAATALMVLASEANAIAINGSDLTDCGTPYCIVAEGTDNSQTAVVDWIVANTEPDYTELYKAEVGGSDEKEFADHYTTVFSNSPTDPQDATISWDGGSSIDCVTQTCYLSVKDGKADPAFYIINISGWDGQSDLVLTGFWPDQGAISNLSIWSSSDQVPAPAPLALLAIGLAGITLRRMRKQA
jgi:MYXO-CTERM domain-containing protein